MSTLVLGDPPPELRALIERRRRVGADRHDEMWEGVYHMVPGPSVEHAWIGSEVLACLRAPAQTAGLMVMTSFNVGDNAGDYRVPDGGMLRPGASGTWAPTAALVFEIVSPGDETWEKLPFYARHDVDEVLIVDPADRSVTWLALSDGEYRHVDRSGLIGLGAAELAGQLEWS